MPKEPVIEDIHTGEGREVSHRDCVRAKVSIQLSKGDWVLKDYISEFQIGARTMIAGLEKGMLGMRQGGERKISFGPHLGYKNKASGNVPANAKLICYVHLLELYDENDPSSSAGIGRMKKHPK